MKFRYDCVAGYHLNFLTCGIAKFNLILAKKLNVDFFNQFDLNLDNFDSPILSVKLSEYTNEDLDALPQWINKWKGRGGYSVFLHGYDRTALEDELLQKANKVYCGNIHMYRQLLPLNINLQSLWCPGTNMSTEAFRETEISVFSFGMAHKLKIDYYYRLKELLDGTGKTYSIKLSTALHEGTSFDESFIEVFKEMQNIFGDRVYFLGYLSDQAVYHYLSEATYFTAFFDFGLRANNTSVNSALEAGVAVITNLDENSPLPLIHMHNIIDINQTSDLLIDTSTYNMIRKNARNVGIYELGWGSLLNHFLI
jgi:hypothetical protein